MPLLARGSRSLPLKPVASPLRPTLLQAGVSIAVISIIRSSLWFTTGGWWGGWWYSTGSFCYLSTSSANLCSYGYVVGAVSIFLSFFVFFTQASLPP